MSCFAVSDVYKPTCLVNRLGCEVGDLSGKYNETLDLPARPSISKYFYTDEIPLSGAYSVIRKSITIHRADKAGARYVCADILQKVSLFTCGIIMIISTSLQFAKRPNIFFSVHFLQCSMSLINSTPRCTGKM